MKKIFINSGHGGKDSGATGNGLKEKDIVLKLGKLITKKLKKDYRDIKVKHYRNNDTFKSLRDITNKSNKWNADIFVSLHVNAGGGTGFETFIYNGSILSSTRSNQDIIHSAIMKEISEFNVRDRGKKRANFHVLRESRSPAILTENMFIDRKSDANLLRNKSFINALVDGHVKGIAKTMNLQKKRNVSRGTYYRVVTGSFRDKKNAQQRMKELKSKGFDSFIDVFRK